MANKMNEQNQELGKENVVNPTVEETTALVETNKEEKKAKIKAGVVKGLKIAGLIGGGFILGLICGKNSNKNEEEEYYYDSNEVEAEVEESVEE